MSATRGAPVSARAALMLAVVAVSTGALFVRLADAPPLVVAFFRCALATAVLAPFAWRACAREWPRLARNERWLALGAGLALALHFATWISSLSFTSVASSLVLVNTTPLWVALLAPFLSSDRVGAGMLFGMALSLVGATVIGIGDFRAAGESFELSGSALWGDLLALAGAWFAALYMLAGRRLRKSLGLLPYVVACYGLAGVFLVVPVIASGASLTGFAPATYGWLVALALVPQVLGHSSYNYALRYVSATVTAVVSLGETIGATALAWLFLGEELTTWTVAGGVLVIVGVCIAVRGERSAARERGG